jgi:hypothetical protein
MSSSTFSSKAEWKVILFVLAVLLATEVTMRLAFTRLSQDLVHVQQIPEKIDRLSAGSGTRILFLGNSITREGIDIEQFEDEVAADEPVTVEEVYPDDTSITEWLYGFLHFIDLPNKNLDLLLICFAEDQLQDRPTIDVRRLAHNYSDWSTALATFRDEAFSIDQRVEFVLSKLWMSFAKAERVQKRILDTFIPYYRITARRINNSFAQPAVKSPVAAPSKPTYRRLERLLDALQSRGVAMMVFAFPVGKEYSIDPGLEQRLGESNVPLFDARNIAGITRKNFPDGYHMDQAAAQLVTKRVSKQVTDWLRDHE